jgi:hypothetical protein
MTTQSEKPPAAMSAIRYPAHAARCARGDHLIHRGDDGRLRAYRVEDLVQLSRLVPFGQGDLIEEQAVVDSMRPAYSGEVYLLLTAFARSFASPEDAIRAVVEGDLGAQTEGLVRNVERFGEADTVVYPARR